MANEKTFPLEINDVTEVKSMPTELTGIKPGFTLAENCNVKPTVRSMINELNEIKVKILKANRKPKSAVQCNWL